MITGIPIVGDAAQRAVDAATYEWEKGIVEAAEEKAMGKESAEYSAGVGDVQDSLSSWAKGRNIINENGEPIRGPEDPEYVAYQAMRREARQSYTAGRDSGASALGWN